MKDQELNKQFHSGSTKIDIVWKDYIENFVEPLKNILITRPSTKKTESLTVLCGLMGISSMIPNRTENV